MPDTSKKPRPSTKIYSLLLVLAALVIAGCGKLPTSGKAPGGDNAITPSPTEETVIRGRA